MDYIECSLEELLRIDPEALVVLAGDFNQLDVNEVTIRTGLTPMVHQPTRGVNTLDMFMISAPDLYSTKVLASVIKTDHRAIIVVTNTDGVRDRNKCSTKRIFRKKTPNQNASLLSDLKDFDDSSIRSILDPQESWDAFYKQM